MTNVRGCGTTIVRPSRRRPDSPVPACTAHDSTSPSPHRQQHTSGVACGAVAHTDDTCPTRGTGTCSNQIAGQAQLPARHQRQPRHAHSASRHDVNWTPHRRRCNTTVVLGCSLSRAQRPRTSWQQLPVVPLDTGSQRAHLGVRDRRMATQTAWSQTIRSVINMHLHGQLGAHGSRRAL